MNTDTHRYGCHNRKPFRELLEVQDGYYAAKGTKAPRWVYKPFKMQPLCQYTQTELGRVDKGCTDCQWREPVGDSA